MYTLADAATRAAVRDRIARLSPNATRRWGRMTPHQMVCHLSDAFRMVDGSLYVKPLDNILSRTFVRLIALHTPMPWPNNVKTAPEVDQRQNGTPPEIWQRDLDDLLARYDAFAPREGWAHPFFGPLTTDEWMHWGFRHIDHHLRQFSS